MRTLSDSKSLNPGRQPRVIGGVERNAGQATAVGRRSLPKLFFLPDGLELVRRAQDPLRSKTFAVTGVQPAPQSYDKEGSM
jgi:hypothetical protein